MGILSWLFGSSPKKENSNKNKLSPLERAEQQLLVTFAYDYRTNIVHFPKTYRYATILGLSSHKSCDVVATTQYVRSIYKFIPLDMYAVADLGIDNFYMLQNAKGEIYECHAYSKLKKAFNSLSDYIAYLEKNNLPIAKTK